MQRNCTSSRLSGRKRHAAAVAIATNGLRRFETRDFQTRLLPLEMAHSGQVPVTCLNLEREILPDLYPGSKESLKRRLGTLDSTGPRVSLISIFFSHGNDGVYIQNEGDSTHFCGPFPFSKLAKIVLQMKCRRLGIESHNCSIALSPHPEKR
ncbi:hypothetical protein AVEN_194391-1 [Araneus ventricosus]|uniref:Caspase family p20 domain-containing protein n=1 Tax=Araneus ventricosus TaxID=182803 RepID=A0A4Y2A7D1_ARAVE|nr:hypothetical protein AVEN_194391-1 [Araneus ventricosus]